MYSSISGGINDKSDGDTDGPMGNEFQREHNITK